jgi:plasmid stabilization system protein ParE
MPEGEARRARLRITDSFIEDAAALCSPKLLRRLRLVLDMLASNPEIGSANVRDSLVKMYGSNIRKIAIATFTLVYRYGDGYVDVLALVYSRRIT